MEFFVHVSNFVDFHNEDDIEPVGVFATIDEARAAVVAGDPEKSYAIIDRFGGEYSLAVA